MAQFFAGSLAELNTAIASANASGDAVNTITLTSSFALTGAPTILNPQGGTAQVIDGDGFTADPIPICCAITVAGDSLVVDFEGSSPQVRGAINATFSFTKWGWVREAGRGPAGDDVLLLRTSLGRHGDEVALQRTDDELVAASLADLRAAIGLEAVPIDAHVQRWGGGLPQYAVGHLARVARIKAAVAEVSGLAVCGAAYDGVGIAPCIASGRAAARQALHGHSGRTAQ